MTEQKYGPNTAAVEALLEELRGFTPEQWKAAGEAWKTAEDKAWKAALKAMHGSSREAAKDAAEDAAWEASWGAPAEGAEGAAIHAACVLVVADLVGQHDLEQWHIDKVSAPIEAARKVQN